MADNKVQQAHALVLGIGCQRDVPCELLERAIACVLDEHGLAVEHVHAIASLDRRTAEPALRELAERHGWQLAFYSADQLAGASYGLQTSELVRERVGSPGVAEPAALLYANGEPLLVSKTVYRESASAPALTLAVARIRDREADRG